LPARASCGLACLASTAGEPPQLDLITNNMAGTVGYRSMDNKERVGGRPFLHPRLAMPAG
jgi:hypothetical protein